MHDCYSFEMFLLFILLRVVIDWYMHVPRYFHTLGRSLAYIGMEFPTGSNHNSQLNVFYKRLMKLNNMINTTLHAVYLLLTYRSYNEKK